MQLSVNGFKMNSSRRDRVCVSFSTNIVTSHVFYLVLLSVVPGWERFQGKCLNVRVGSVPSSERGQRIEGKRKLKANFSIVCIYLHEEQTYVLAE